MAFGLSSLIPFVGPALNVASSLFGKKEGGGETVNTTTSSQQLLYDWISKYLPQYTPGQEYTGQMVAPKTSQETQSLDFLNQYLNAPNVGALGTAAQGQLMNTLSGQYMDPATSPYIQAQQKMAQTGLEDAISQARLGQGARGGFYKTAALGEERKLTENTQNYLNSLIGQFIENERGRQYGAVPYAMQAEEYTSKTAPLAKVGAGQSYGSLDRTLAQASLEAQYQNWANARKEMSSLPEIASGSQTGMNWTMPTTTSNNTFGNIVSALGQTMPTQDNNTILSTILNRIFK